MSVRESNAQWVAPVRITAVVVDGLGLFAMLLAAMGIYGVIAYTVSQRTPEIGLRLALGATRTGVMRLVVRQAVELAGIGLIFGTAAAVALERILRSQFFGAHSSTTILFLLAVPVFSVMAALASWVPARRAARIDPMATLRAD